MPKVLKILPLGSLNKNAKDPTLIAIFTLGLGR